MTNVGSLCLLISAMIVWMLILLTRCDSVTRSARLPLDVLNGVAYLNLKNLCQVSVQYQANLSGEFDGLEETQIEFDDTAQLNSHRDVKVLIDTGSAEFWLADSSCYQCTHTQNFCPHLKPNKQVLYVKGKIEAADSYINLCSNRIKFLCVKSVQGLGQINGHGILGLTHEAAGFSMLFNTIKKKPISQKKIAQYLNPEQPSSQTHKNTIAWSQKQSKKEKRVVKQQYSAKISYGRYKSYLYISYAMQIQQPITSILEQENIISCEKDWSFDVKEIGIFQTTISFNHSIKVHVDTGSSKIVFSYQLCTRLIEQAQNLGLTCYYVEGQGIDCNRIVTSVQFTLQPIASTKPLQIQDSHLLDPISNRLQILCQPPKSQTATTPPTTQTTQTTQTTIRSSQHILLGYPFIRSGTPTFITTVTKHLKNKQVISTSSKYEIKVTDPVSMDKSEDAMLRMLIGIYVVGVVVVAWACLVAIDQWRSRRSTKIII